MLHTKYINADGQVDNAYVIPLVTLGEGKNAVIVNLKVNDETAHMLALLALAGRDTSDTDNRLKNSLVRKAAASMLHALANIGKQEDTFYFHMPIDFKDRDSKTDLSKWTPVFGMTRGTLAKIANVVQEIDKVITPALAQADKLAESVKDVTVKVLNPEPSYTPDQPAKTRGKKSGKVIEI